jgi:hypothetical protein
MGRTRDTSKIFTTALNQEDLDERIFISSASPTTGNIDGRIWVDTSSASAPVLQTYGLNSFRNPKLSKFKALGGLITEFGPYTVHTFLGTGSFIPLEFLTVEYLIVAGGGGGGTTLAGGGGAGGYLTGTANLSQETFLITIGAGGPTVTNGVNSSAFNFTSIGGGKGGSGNNVTGGVGGSGGGGAGNNTLPVGTVQSNWGTGTSGQGNRGGGGNRTAAVDGGGGGGGAGNIGGNCTGLNTAFGGPGLQWLDGNYYAGGGAGVTSTSGGIGGGGASGSSGLENTGGGGGASGTGGSGIVIIRYLT